MACRSTVEGSIRTCIYAIRSRPLQRSRFFSVTRSRNEEDPIQSGSTRATASTQIPPKELSPAETTTKTIQATATTDSSNQRTNLGASTSQQNPATRSNSVLDMLTSVGTNLGGSQARQPSSYGLTNILDKYKSPSGPQRLGDDEYHLHVYSHRRNTHLTLCDTDRKSLISISTGNIGFQKSQRNTYDAAYQLMAYMLSRIQQQGLMPKIHKLELCLRGFGPGRDAVTKVLLGQEGTRLRDAIVRVVDKTRLKIGGNRSPKPRRLG